jgi:hypothetical protein
LESFLERWSKGLGIFSHSTHEALKQHGKADFNRSELKRDEKKGGKGLNNF